jgi:glycosyltransferase involved in cell wall biosynthesis
MRSVSDVAVVIPCFNQGAYLREALESVFSQTLPPHEVIVVDDGSTDDTAAVAASFSNVTYLRQENRGLSAARNRGMAAASCGYITFLDADDLLLPRALEIGVRELSVRPECAFVFGRFRYRDHDHVTPQPPPLSDALAAPYESLLRTNFIAMHATVMYRRAFLVSLGGFDETMSAAEDYDVYLRVTAKAPVAMIDEVVAIYRLHDDNMSNDAVRVMRNAIAALEKQRAAVAGDRRLRAVLREGVRDWRMWMVERQARAARIALSRGRWLRAAAALAAGVRVSPSTAVRFLVARNARRRMRRKIDFGDFRRLEPVSSVFGFDRGTPVDRVYIERFLERHATDIRGRVLEVGSDDYTRRFGGSRVEAIDILHVDSSNPRATVVGSVADTAAMPADRFDCIILTQTLLVVFDLRAAAESIHKMLRPGGVALITAPGITPIGHDVWSATTQWLFTPLSMRTLLTSVFGEGNVEVSSDGNVLAATAFLQGVAAEELTRAELDHRDARYPVIVAARAGRRETV